MVHEGNSSASDYFFFLGDSWSEDLETARTALTAFLNLKRRLIRLRFNGGRRSGTFLKTMDAIHFGVDAPAPGSSASLNISVVSSWHALTPVLQLTLIVFLATTSELST
jgi:hypothetical protein